MSVSNHRISRRSLIRVVALASIIAVTFAGGMVVSALGSPATVTYYGCLNHGGMITSVNTSRPVHCWNAKPIQWTQLGPIGPVGPTGAIGPTGATVLTGDTGPIGPTGAIGSIGPTGPTGAVGPAGATGPIGVTGSVGITGSTGATGATGPAGMIGTAGPAGPSGSSGPSGPQGTTSGMVGLQAITNVTSLKCDTQSDCAFQLDAVCPSGSSPVGGGANALNGGAFLVRSAVVSSGGGTNNAWEAVWHIRSDASDGGTYQYDVVAYCATSNP